MTPNQEAFKFFNTFTYVKETNNEYRDIGFENVSLMVALDNVNLMHITGTVKHPKEQFNFKEAKKQLYARMNKYTNAYYDLPVVPDNPDINLGITYTFRQFVDNISYIPNTFNTYALKNFGDFRFISLEGVWSELYYQSRFAKDIVHMLDKIMLSTRK